MKTPVRLLLIFGTRPEAIKTAPLIKALAREKGFESVVCVTGQHRELLDGVLRLFAVKPQFDLNIMTPGQSLVDTASAVLKGVSGVVASCKPDRIIVQGDTTTTLYGALAAYYAKVPVAHVEAGLRTGVIYSPWPEEIHRKLTTSVADVHFAPTEGARQNLLAEGVNGNSVHVTGNTVIDALLDVTARLEKDAKLRAEAAQTLPPTAPGKRLVLVTCHRRESFGRDFESICRALSDIARRDDVELVFPLHPNPEATASARRVLENTRNIRLTGHLDYLPFVHLMNRAHIILTDSGGIQEEAPSLGKPVLVMRNTTERPEAVNAGATMLTGTDRTAIVNAANSLLDDADLYAAMSRAGNPYGDGRASVRITDVLKKLHGL